ncbi:MAG: hypothetical protein CME19_18550 [Gemmatimonadetes bacterium]|nr:hypothetical protein [Gemmatimonadota bacterium]
MWVKQDEIRTQVIQVYEEFAPIHRKYPDREFSLEITRFEKITEEILAYENPTGETSYLDVGCGSGHMPMLASLSGYRAFGADYQIYESMDPEDLDLHREIWKRYEVDIRQADAMSQQGLPFEDEAFDIVSCCAVVEHLHGSPKPALQEMVRVTRPGGVVLIEVPNLARLQSRIALLLGQSIHESFDTFLDSGQPYFGHFREYTLAETRALGEHVGLEPLLATAFNIEILRSRSREARYRGRPLLQRVAFRAAKVMASPFRGLREAILCVFRKPI